MQDWARRGCICLRRTHSGRKRLSKNQNGRSSCKSLKTTSNGVDCVMIRQMLQARACKNKGETAKYAAMVVENRMNNMQAKRVEDRQTARCNRKSASTRGKSKQEKRLANRRRTSQIYAELERYLREHQLASKSCSERHHQATLDLQWSKHRYRCGPHMMQEWKRSAAHSRRCWSISRKKHNWRPCSEIQGGGTVSEMISSRWWS